MTAPLKDIDSKRLIVEIANQLNQYHIDALKEVPRELDPYIQPILALITKEKIKELEELKKYMTLYPVDPEWQYAAPEKQIDIALRELKQQLGDKSDE